MINTLIHFRIGRNTDLFAEFEAAYKDKFLAMIEIMEVQDIVGLYRIQIRGP